MGLILTDEQELLKQSATDFLTDHSPVSHLRALRDEKDDVGFSRAIWKEMGELGWTGILFAEKYGGSELGFAELGVVLEECGRMLAPYPFVSTILLGGRAVQLGGSESQKAEILAGICNGETVVAMAFQEKGRFDPYAVETTAEASGDGFVLAGSKQFVLDGHVADHLVVVARTSGASGDRDGLTLFLVDPATSGISIQRTLMVDSRNAANISFEGAVVDASRVLGEVDAGAELLDPILDHATIALSAEIVGIASEVLDRTIEYLKVREQFGVRIGTFQALKHRAAQMFCEVELSRSIALDALRAVDEDRPDIARLASAAKAKCSDTASLVTCEGLQMHGGIGMTDEEEIGLFLKRAKAAELTFGDGFYHRERFARLTSF